MTLTDNQWDLMFAGWIVAVLLLAELWFDYRRQFPRRCKACKARGDDLMALVDVVQGFGPEQERIP